ncbi:pimeloyl-ACP methyl esterase BioG family protein [Paracoccus litorisediminis]|uniref:DUF452 family protein n=1 Tax=Paracoccus litorisediminis TaxID=2006130 RepID=A0A844HMY0_9RHOB|nr:pimeloyl-ACP methyl esterase BioG family protein [Paracoccus litorisediminis]MTH61270.1 DUF452 family protein [Paracoccus litorisediminis]
MRQTWLRRGQDRSLILVYSGWAVGVTPFLHLIGDSDVLVLDDYRDEILPHALLAPYARVRVLAYSLGVTVAARQLAAVTPDRAVAVCGSPYIAHERYGIAPEIYARTMAEVTPAALDRFARRAGVALPAAPDVAALHEELALIARRPAASPATGDVGFDWVFAGRRDRIFTAQSMRSVWAGRQVSWLETGHNPFPIWQDWEEIFA